MDKVTIANYGYYEEYIPNISNGTIFDDLE